MFKKNSLPNIMNRVFLKEKIEEPVLILGCGYDLLRKELNQKGIINVTLSDIENYAGEEKGFIKHDLNNLPYPFSRYKTIFLIGTIQYLENPLLVLKEIYSLLEDDGKLFINFFKKSIDKYEEVPLLHLFDEKTARNLIKKANFSIIYEGYNTHKIAMKIPPLSKRISRHVWYILQK